MSAVSKLAGWRTYRCAGVDHELVKRSDALRLAKELDQLRTKLATVPPLPLDIVAALKLTSQSDTPITDSLAFVNLDDVWTCKVLERALAKCVEALREIRIGRQPEDYGKFDICAARLIGIAGRALAAVEQLEEKYRER